jgi:hypothetical protein
MIKTMRLKRFDGAKWVPLDGIRHRRGVSAALDTPPTFPADARIL